MIKLNCKYLFLSVGLFIIEVIIALYIRDNLIRPYVGDVLVVVLIYCIIKSFVQKEIKLLPLYIFAFAVLVEISQLFNMASVLGFNNNTIARIVIGSVFDWLDILCYFIGAIMAAVMQWMDSKNKKLILPIFVTSVLVSAPMFAFLAYNGLWWPVYPEGMGYKIKGVDVARYQGDIDWKVISEQNIRFAFIKATEGSSYKDPYFDKNIIESNINGIANGAYHFFSADSPGNTQAANFIAATSPYEIDLPLVVDFEIATERVVEKEKIIAELLVLLHEIKNITGVEPIIYTTYECYTPYLTDGFANYQFWFRDLMNKPYFDGNLLFWQYSNRGRLKGIDEAQKYIDLNVFMGSEQEFNALIAK